MTLFSIKMAHLDVLVLHGNHLLLVSHVFCHLPLCHLRASGTVQQPWWMRCRRQPFAGGSEVKVYGLKLKLRILVK